MEEVKRKKQPILYVILILLVLNLFVTVMIFLVLVPMLRYSSSAVSHVKQNDLPSGLQSNENRRALFEKFKEHYNNRNYDQLYSMLDEVAQMEISKETFPQQVNSLYELVGDIENGAYAHYASEVSGQMKTYVLYYTLKVTKGSKKAMLSFSLAQQGNEPYRIYGFNLTSQY